MKKVIKHLRRLCKAVNNPFFLESDIPNDLKIEVCQALFDLGQEIMPAIDREIEACQDEIDFYEHDPADDWRG